MVGQMLKLRLIFLQRVLLHIECIHERIPRAALTTALCTFAVSIGFLSDEILTVPGTIPSVLSPVQATSVVLDNHYIITAAHALIYNTANRKFPPDRLRYK